MALDNPRTDIMTAIGFNQVSFVCPPGQTFAETVAGSILAEQQSSPLWHAVYSSVPKRMVDITTFEAKLRSLNGMMRMFTAYDLRRPYPAAYSNGVFADSGKIHTLSSVWSLRLKDLPASFQIKTGDYFHFTYGSNPTSRALHQAMEDITADGSGTTAEFQVYPFIRAGAAVDAAVTFKKASAIFTLKPVGFEPSMSDVLSGAVSFEAIQYLP